MKLILTPHGTAELVDKYNRTLWASDDDQDFLEEFDGDDFIREEDVGEVLEYLADVQLIEDEDIDEIDVEVQSLQDDGDDDDSEIAWPEILDEDE